MVRWSRLCAYALVGLGSTPAFGQELRTTPLAEAFAANPALRGMRLSPDGARTVHIQNLADGTVTAVVIDVAAGTEKALAVGGADSHGIESCEWANASRLLCTIMESREAPPRPARVAPPRPANLRGLAQPPALPPPPSVQSMKRLVAVDRDGSNRVSLLETSRAISPIVDWLADEPDHVLLQILDTSDERFESANPLQSSIGQMPMALVKVDMRTAQLTPVQEAAERDDHHERLLDPLAANWMTEWMTDRSGSLRVYAVRELPAPRPDPNAGLTPRERRAALAAARRTEVGEAWFGRAEAGAEWTELYRRDFGGPSEPAEPGGLFIPIGFSADRNELLYTAPHDGRTALFALSFEPGHPRRLVFSHPDFDVSVGRIGPDRAPAYVSYDNGRRQYVFDERANQVRARLQGAFPGAEIFIVDRDQDGSHYVVLVQSVLDAATYYHYDVGDAVASEFATVYPSLSGRKLAMPQSIAYSAGRVEHSGYLFVPPEGTATRGAVVMPPNSNMRDLYQHDPFAQFLAANGYIVLRTDQRVPPRDDAGVALGQSLDGILFDYERVSGLLAAGATWLAESGLVDPQRICVVGHGTGGAYLAYVTAVEHPRQFACAAAVSESALGARVVGGGGGAFFSQGPLVKGNPIRRAEDLEVPIFIAHVTNETIANSFEQRNPMVGFSFAALVEALRRGEKSYVAIERDGPARAGQSERYRVDALTRVVEFIDEQLGQTP